MDMPLYQYYLHTKQKNPGKFARDLAQIMGVSEAELTHARVGQDADRLNVSASTLLTELESVGVTKSITRNDYAVHEHLGVYQNLRLHGHLGLVLNPRALDLRLFFNQWGAIFSLRESMPHGDSLSIQCFDLQGNAVHKIYCTNETNLQAWKALVTKYRTLNNAPLELQIADNIPIANALIDSAAIDDEWRQMNDIHQFFMLLKRNNITRQQAFRAVGDDLAYQVNNQALMQVLNAAQTHQNEIMIFVGNNGCMQIFTGVISELMLYQDKQAPKHNWINVINKRFTLHLIENAIAESWITRKPTKDGFISSLELLDKNGNQIIQLFGQRNEGEPEQRQWRDQLEALTAISNRGIESL